MSSSASGGDPFVDLYRSYIGEPDSRMDIYLGFALFFGGIGLGLIGLVLFAIERGVVAADLFWLRELAFATGALGLPVVLVSVVVLLPADRRATYVAGIGFVITLGAIAFFISVYPSNWNHGTPDYSLQGVTVYAIGLITVLAATAAALVSYHIERVQGGSGAAGQTPLADETHGGGSGRVEEVTDEQVRRDIDEAMADTEISWGGVEKVDMKRLRITPDEKLEGTNLDRSSAKVHRSSSVDDQLDTLRGLKGGERRTDSGDGTDEQMAALRELREKQQAEAMAKPDGLVGRLKDLIGR